MDGCVLNYLCLVLSELFSLLCLLSTVCVCVWVWVCVDLDGYMHTNPDEAQHGWLTHSWLLLRWHFGRGLHHTRVILL